MTTPLRLKVELSNLDEVFTDMVRIPKLHRNLDMDNGTVIRLDHNGKKAFAIVRGLGNRKDAVIQMDEFIRRRLGVSVNDQIDRCGIRRAKPLERVLWYLQATNPAVHVPAWLAVISIGLGVVSIVLTLAT